MSAREPWVFNLRDVPPEIEKAIRETAARHERPLRWAALRLLALGVQVERWQQTGVAPGDGAR